MYYFTGKKIAPQRRVGQQTEVMRAQNFMFALSSPEQAYTAQETYKKNGCRQQHHPYVRAPARPVRPVRLIRTSPALILAMEKHLSATAQPDGAKSNATYAHTDVAGLATSSARRKRPRGSPKDL